VIVVVSQSVSVENAVTVEVKVAVFQTVDGAVTVLKAVEVAWNVSYSVVVE
jgi:hypothetical protein